MVRMEQAQRNAKDRSRQLSTINCDANSAPLRDLNGASMLCFQFDLIRSRSSNIRHALPRGQNGAGFLYSSCEREPDLLQTCRNVWGFGGRFVVRGSRFTTAGVCLWAVRGRNARTYLYTKIVKELAVQAGQTLLVDGANEAFVRRPSGHTSSLWNYERPTTLGHIPNADRGIVMEKRVTSLEVGKFETCRLLGISDSKLQEE
ncbi:hypothetical protein F5882DRAFT_378923 [Hyaloscypha sp. PMI_1271]|nr:hypothetical protein F5882DRAFT_378923 [Hyaloscypha sp. PMI_1271]